MAGECVVPASQVGSYVPGLLAAINDGWGSGQDKAMKSDDAEYTDADRLAYIRALVVGVGRTGRNNGMDMLADSVLRILDATEHPKTAEPS